MKEEVLAREKLEALKILLDSTNQVGLQVNIYHIRLIEFSFSTFIQSLIFYYCLFYCKIDLFLYYSIFFYFFSYRYLFSVYARNFHVYFKSHFSLHLLHFHLSCIDNKN